MAVAVVNPPVLRFVDMVLTIRLVVIGIRLHDFIAVRVAPTLLPAVRTSAELAAIAV